MEIALIILVAILTLTNAATAILLTVFHQKEKRDLHDRLMAKSPDEYVYDTLVAPAEAKALREEFLRDHVEKPPAPEKSPMEKKIGRMF